MKWMDKMLAGAAMLGMVLCIASGLFSIPMSHINTVYAENRAAYGRESDTEIAYLCDEGEKLTAEEYDIVWSSLQETAQETGMHIGVWIGSTPMGQNATFEFCDNTYDDHFGINTDGIFLYLDLSGESNLYDHISTSGMGQFYYSNGEDCNRIQDMFDAMNPYLSMGEEYIPEALDQFFGKVQYYAEKGTPSETYYVYNGDTNLYTILDDGVLRNVSKLPAEYTGVCSWKTITLIALLIGVVAGVFIFFSIRMHYRFKKAFAMDNYLQDQSVQYTVRTDQFLRRYQSKTKISSNNNSSIAGGGSSHSSSFGGNHGGGGNHR